MRPVAARCACMAGGGTALMCKAPVSAHIVRGFVHRGTAGPASPVTHILCVRRLVIQGGKLRRPRLAPHASSVPRAQLSNLSGGQEGLQGRSPACLSEARNQPKNGAIVPHTLSAAWAATYIHAHEGHKFGPACRRLHTAFKTEATTGHMCSLPRP